ncbi:MAG: hypothetical protein RJA35_334 [Actinomycetota bacterium]|jgi:hypothetical protein
MELRFTNQMIEWRGPAPFYYVPVPADESAMIKETARQTSYGWGVIPVIVRIGKTEFSTSLFPKDGAYLVPVKAAVRLPEKLSLGDEVEVSLEIDFF